MSHPLYVKKEWKLDAPNREIKDWFLFDTCYVEYSDADLDKVYISIDNLQPIRLSAVASGINLGFPRPTFHLIKITWEPSENGKTLKMVFGREKFVITALSVRILQDLVGLAKEETAQAVRNKLDSNLDVKLSTRASESTLSTIKSKLDSNFDVKLSTRASEDTLSSIDGKITKCDTDNVKVVNTANPPNLDIKLSEHRDTVKRPWGNDEVHGTATPISGVAGDNTITVKSGGNIDFDPAGKYLKAVVVELESYASGDYIKEIAITDGTTRVTVAKNIPLTFSGKEVTFTSPVEIPSGNWVEVVVTLSADKGITAVTELVW